MASVIIPAHNEANVIGRCLEALVSGPNAAGLEIIVVCNGCSDETARIAGRFGDQVRVIEVDQPSKSNALNVGDRAANSFPRIYADADIVMSAASVRALERALSDEGVLAAAPTVDTVFPQGTSWMVRAYYALWLSLPYIREGMVTAGVYALSAAGRARFEAFPDIISDDGYVRSLFAPSERSEVSSAKSAVSAPRRLSDLVKIRTRGRLGGLELKQKFPQLFLNVSAKGRYRGALATILGQPRLYAGILPYVWVSLVSLVRARRQARNLQAYVWERDHSSRDTPGFPSKI